jgi:hypothetical protein
MILARSLPDFIRLAAVPGFWRQHLANNIANIPIQVTGGDWGDTSRRNVETASRPMSIGDASIKNTRVLTDLVKVFS